MLAWPSSGDRAGVFGLAALFGLIFLVFYGGASYLSGFVPYRIRVDLPFERALPFLPVFAPVYLSMDLLVGLAPFVFRDWRRLLPMFAALTVQTLIGAFCFILLPVATNFPERVVTGAAAPAFALADLMNLERNFLPSLHVAYAVTAALFYGALCRWPGRLFFAGWALAIALSTMLIHEHHLLDVLAGALLAVWAWRSVGRRFARAAVLDAWEVEGIVLKSYLAFARRHRRYVLIALGLTRASLPRWRERRILRTGFCFLQIIDDLLDGDRPCEREPLEPVDELIAALDSGDFSRGTAGATSPGESEGEDRAVAELWTLARFFRADLLAAAGRPALDDALELMRVMQYDRRRVRDGLLLGADELREQHRKTFYYSVDLMLVAAGAELRAGDLPELIEAFGWCSTVRDLREDLAAGLVNIPREVVAAAGAVAGRSRDELIASAAVRDWMGAELSRARYLLDRTDERLAELRERRGAQVLAMFARSIRAYADRKVPARYADLLS